MNLLINLMQNDNYNIAEQSILALSNLVWDDVDNMNAIIGVQYILDFIERIQRYLNDNSMVHLINRLLINISQRHEFDDFEQIKKILPAIYKLMSTIKDFRIQVFFLGFLLFRSRNFMQIFDDIINNQVKFSFVLRTSP